MLVYVCACACVCVCVLSISKDSSVYEIYLLTIKVSNLYMYRSCFSRRSHPKSRDKATRNSVDDKYEEVTEMTKSALYKSSRMAPLPQKCDSKDESRLKKLYSYVNVV